MIRQKEMLILSKIHSQSMMRYNQLITQVVDVTIPLNMALNAGSVIRCEFPTLETSERKEPDQKLVVYI